MAHPPPDAPVEPQPVVIPAIWRHVALGATLVMVATGVLLLVQSLLVGDPSP